MKLRSMMRCAARSGDRGQLLPIAGLAMIVLCGASALAVDVGYERYTQRLQQNAADSAALAGAVELLYPAPAQNPSTSATLNCPVSTSANVTGDRVKEAAYQDAACNGFTDDSNATVGVTVNHPPASGAYANNANAVEVIIDAKHPTFFQQIFGRTSMREAARAVATVRPGGNICVLALQTGSGSLLSLNASNVNAPDCAFLSNGRLSANGGATIIASQIGAVGNISDQSGTFPLAQPGPAVLSTDPCPTIVGCEFLAANPPSTTTCTPDPGTSILSPGTYCSLNLSNRQVVFNSGLYVITSGGISGNSSTTLTGTGVTFYIAGGKVDINNVGGFSLSAPTSGSYEGMLMYQPPSNTTGPMNLNSAVGSIAGIIYAPSIHLNSNASFTSFFGLIVGDANINSAAINIPATNNVPGLQHAVLAE